MRCLYQEERLHLSIHNLTWQEYWSYYEPQYFYPKKLCMQELFVEL